MNFLGKLFQKKPKVERIEIRKRFELIAPVGQGTMSKVSRARDVLTGRTVAVKVLDKLKTERLEQRFVGMNRPLEGEIAMTLRHPNIVRTIDHGITTADEQFLVMEFIDGVGLSYLIDAQNPRMLQHRLWYIVQMGEALDYLHKQKWIHRDFCPRNVIITDDNEVKVFDFGLVVPNTDPFRAPGNRTGTPLYMAPELIKRLKTDERIDVFSFAVSCFEMFSKKLPWEAGNSLESVVQHINKPPAELRKLAPDTDEEVAAIIMQGLETDPSRRWASARKMTDAFRGAAARLKALPKTNA